MVIAAIAPHLDALAVLFVLRLHIRVSVHAVGRIPCKDVSAVVLTEDAKIGGPVLLPESLKHFVRGRSEDANATCLTIDPVAFECTAIRPYQLSIATLVVLIIND